jgi:GDPmannose 4,6-dehydratase
LKKVLITGALGQDGIILSKLYLKKKFKVFGFINKKKENRIKKVIYKINDLKSKKKIVGHLKIIKPDIILHLASSNNSYLKRKNKENYKINYLQNLRLTQNLLNSIVENNLKTNFIFAGSSLMFQNNFEGKVSENTNFKSDKYYGKYKIDSHNLIMSMKERVKIKASTVILFNHDSIYRNKKFLIPRLIKAFIDKDHFFIENIYKQNISGDFSHADDICEGIYRLSVSKLDIDKLILSSGKRFYVNRIINFLENFFNFKIKKKIVKKNINFNLVGSNKFAKKLLNYKAKKTSLQACKEIIKIIYKS